MPRRDSSGISSDADARWRGGAMVGSVYRWPAQNSAGILERARRVCAVRRGWRLGRRDHRRGRSAARDL